MDQNNAPGQPSLLGRRELLKAGALGVTAFGLAGLAPLAEAFQTGAGGQQVPTTDSDPRTRARNEREWRMNLAQLGTLSLMASEMAIRKGQRAEVKEFANFEATEQRGVAAILQEMGTPPPPLDAMSRAVARQHEVAEGVEFDRVYARAQLETHQKLLLLNQSIVAATEGTRNMREMHARHLAMLAIPAITEHIAHSQELVALLGS